MIQKYGLPSILEGTDNDEAIANVANTCSTIFVGDDSEALDEEDAESNAGLHAPGLDDMPLNIVVAKH